MNVDIAPTETITLAQAQGFYGSLMERIRNNHAPVWNDPSQGQPWDIAIAHALLNVSDWEASVILGYLSAQPCLAKVDVMLVESIARRLGLKIEWKRTELV